LELETVFLLDVGVFGVVNFGEEHVIRPAPEAAVAIKGAVGDHFLFGFGMINNIFEKVEIAFEMAIDAVEAKTGVFGLHIVYYGRSWELCR